MFPVTDRMLVAMHARKTEGLRLLRPKHSPARGPPSFLPYCLATQRACITRTKERLEHHTSNGQEIGEDDNALS